MALLGITLAVEQIAIAAILMIGGWALYGLRVYDDYQLVPERKLIRYCRKKEVPLLAITNPGSGKATLYPGKKKKKEAVKFDIPGTTSIYLDPEFTGMAEPMLLRRGLPFYIWPSTHPTPVSIKNMKALTQLVGDVRALQPVLNFLQDDEIIALMNTPRDFLGEYAEQFEEKYRPKERDGIGTLSATEIQTAIIDVQDRLSSEKVRFDAPLLIRTALRLTPSAYLAQDVHQLEIIAEAEAERKTWFTPDHKFMMVAGFVGLMVIVGGAIAYNMIT